MPAPKVIHVSFAGLQLSVFTIGVLAEEIGRTTTCIRRWLRLGIAPRPVFKAKNGYRVFCRQELNTYKRVCAAEKVGSGRAFAATQFSARLHEEVDEIRSAFRRLADEGSV